MRSVLAIRRRLVVAATGVLLALGSVAVRAELPNASGAPIGTVTPWFEGRTLEGRVVHPADFTGKVLVLNFWATWCPPCRAETADLIASYKALSGPDVSFLGVDTTETATVVKSFASLKGMPYTTALADPIAYNRFGISYIPTTIVLDAQGVVRARWTGKVSPEQLHSYVESARQGKDGIYLTAEQQKIDALVDPAPYRFDGDALATSAAVDAATKQLRAADDYTARLDAGPSVRYDFERTNHEKGRLRVAIGLAQQRIASTPDQRAAAVRALGKGYGELNRWHDAADLYRDAFAHSPHDGELADALTRAYYRLHDYDAMAEVARKWVAIDASNGDAQGWLGLAEQRRRHFASAVSAYEKSIAALEQTARKEAIGKDGDAVTSVADTALDLANVYVSLGDAAGAARTFALAKHYAALIPASGANAPMRERVDERTTEGMTAVALGRSDHPKLTIAPWVGADLPGSLKTGIRYRLVVVAPAGRDLTLSTSALAPGWIASFCAHGLCSPRSVRFVVPENGLETYEFQLVPPNASAKPGPVVISASGAASVTIR